MQHPHSDNCQARTSDAFGWSAFGLSGRRGGMLLEGRTPFAGGPTVSWCPRVPTAVGSRYNRSRAPVRALLLLSKSLLSAYIAKWRSNLAASQAGGHPFESGRPVAKGNEMAEVANAGPNKRPAFERGTVSKTRHSTSPLHLSDVLWPYLAVQWREPGCALVWAAAIGQSRFACHYRRALQAELAHFRRLRKSRARRGGNRRVQYRPGRPLAMCPRHG
jgi:hypothetical protein